MLANRLPEVRKPTQLPKVPKPSAIEKVLYTAKAHTTGGRDGGESRTSDGRLEVKLTVPGSPRPGTNPGQLIACHLRITP